ncbi:MAG: hypothetical protein Q7S00_06265, partial [bacterium]|nr:hypothetical protein [bacterium]
MEVAQGSPELEILPTVTLRYEIAGEVVSEIGIAPVEPVLCSTVRIQQDSKNQRRTGVVVANPNMEAVSVTMEVINEGNKEFWQARKKTDTLSAVGHTSWFFDEKWSEFIQDPTYAGRGGRFLGAL